jgi:HSP20 family protein
MTLMRFDPFRELDRFSEQVLAGPRAMRAMPMEAFRRGGEFVIALDLPGADPDDVDVTVERNVINVHATRRPVRREGDEVLVDERPQGDYSRHLFLGDNLDTSKLRATFERGVLVITIPVSESSKPRHVEIASAPERQSVETGAQQRETAKA